MSWIRRHFETVLIPLAGIGLYAAFIYTSEAGRAAQIVSAIGFVFVLMLYFGFRRLRVHAAASRLAAIGDADKLLVLVERERPRRLIPSTRAPLYIFEAVAHNLRGDWAAARRALDAADVPGGERARASWEVLWRATDIHNRTATGDLAGARESLKKMSRPGWKGGAPVGIELLLRECEARIALLEGDTARARERIAPLVKDIRLGVAARAQLYAILAAAAAAEGDRAAAAEHAATARKLAPSVRLVADTPP